MQFKLQQTVVKLLAVTRHHPFSAAYLKSGRGGSRLSKATQTFLSPAPQATQGIPGPDEKYNLSIVFPPHPEVSCQLDMRGRSPVDGAWGAS